jgi:hypothetical protein
MKNSAAGTLGFELKVGNANPHAAKSTAPRTFAAACAAVALLLTPCATLANKKAAMLPTAVLAAKTIYIDNQTNDATLQNDAYLELAKWGHLQVVDAAQKADVVLRLTGSSYVKTVARDTPPDMSMKPAIVRAGGTAGTGNAILPNGDEAAPVGFTRLTLMETKSGNAVWSEISKTKNPKAASHILDGLRAAFEQGLKAHGE